MIRIDIPSCSCELAIEHAWVTIDDILEKRIPIDSSYVGLESVLMDCCHQILRGSF